MTSQRPGVKLGQPPLRGFGILSPDPIFWMSGVPQRLGQGGGRSETGPSTHELPSDVQKWTQARGQEETWVRWQDRQAGQGWVRGTSSQAGVRPYLGICPLDLRDPETPPECTGSAVSVLGPTLSWSFRLLQDRVRSRLRPLSLAGVCRPQSAQAPPPQKTPPPPSPHAQGRPFTYRGWARPELRPRPAQAPPRPRPAP